VETLKIVSVETFSTRYVSVVRIKSDDGSVGYGQVAPYNADITATILQISEPWSTAVLSVSTSFQDLTPAVPSGGSIPRCGILRASVREKAFVSFSAAPNEE
jgi:hypothetical protein